MQTTSWLTENSKQRWARHSELSCQHDGCSASNVGILRAHFLSHFFLFLFILIEENCNTLKIKIIKLAERLSASVHSVSHLRSHYKRLPAFGSFKRR